MALVSQTGLIVHSTLAVAGLALAFDRFPVFRKVMCWAAAGYLMWLAYRILNEVLMIWCYRGKVEVAEPEAARQPFIRGLLCNLLNPKAAIFLAAVSARWDCRRAGSFAVGTLGMAPPVGASAFPPQSGGAVDRSRFGIALVALAVRLLMG